MHLATGLAPPRNWPAKLKLSMDFQSIIATRRDGKRHSDGQLRFLAKGAADGSIPDYQLSAWLMAAFLNPLSDEETTALTLAMAESGERIDLTGLPKPWVDKHSTGGVGDKTSIILLPLLAACGLTLVKMSGRGLGVTGGTLDKLESVPGFRVDLSPGEMKAQAAKIGLAITGQSPNLAPADKTLYALRDATGTTSNIPLLVSSILCKKIAGGAETVVLDVKCGSGAFMHTYEGAHALAVGLARTAKAAGLKCRLAITDMDQPLGTAGNALEVAEALQVLSCDWTNDAIRRTVELCVTLAGIALHASGLASSEEEGRARAQTALTTGAAHAKAAQWFEAQGGAIDAELPVAPIIREVMATEDGWISRIDAETIGYSVIALGGGRRKKEDKVDPRVGIQLPHAIGSRVRQGVPLATVHAATEADAEEAERQVRAAFSLSPSEYPVSPIVRTIL